jgi:hypothetical protein
MSRNLQGLIRPSSDVNPPRRVIAPEGEEAENIVIAFGKDGSHSVKTVSLSGSDSSTSYMDKQQRETTEPESAVEI